MIHIKVFTALTFVGLTIFFEKIEGYNTGIILYDPATRKKLLPPIVTSTKYKIREMPSVGQPCLCKKLRCQCCVGMRLEAFNFDRRMCANVKYTEKNMSLRMQFQLNEQTLASYSFKAWNPPPFCIPIGLPIPVNLCIKMYDMKFDQGAMHMCMDWIMQVFQFDIFTMHFNCMRLSTGGIEFVQPGGAAGSGFNPGEIIQGDTAEMIGHDEVLPDER